MPWSRQQIAERAVKELREGQYVNLGIGIPTMIANCELPVKVMLHNENGHLGCGPFPYEGDEDADLISASKQTITEVPGSSFFDAASSFGMIRGGHIDVTFLGGMQVSERGDFANWAIPGQLIKGMGGAMDLAVGAKRVIVLMEHMAKGKPRLVKNCTLPLTAVGCVDMVITDLGVFEVDDGFVVKELAEGVTIAEVKAKTGATVHG
jgi:3-oxoacid CoA-transferase subunit B